MTCSPPRLVQSGINRIFTITTLALLLGVAAGAQELMPGASSGWSGFSARPDTTPAVTASTGSPYTLEAYGNGVRNVYGGWRARLAPVSGGQFYRFRARAVAMDIPSIRESVTILLRWRGSFGDEVAPDDVWEYRVQADGTLLFDRTLQAPPGTTAVDVELVLQWAANGRVRFEALSFIPAHAPSPRTVKVAAISFRPSGTSSGRDSVQRAERYGEQVAAAERPDVMVFGELLNVIGAPGTYDAKAESVPGPSTDTMATLARRYGAYVVFGMLEREGTFLYNTAVLLDRNGAIVAKYRKVQLPLSEVSAGISPGRDVPVFQTDFGKVALLICQDTAFPEPARQAAILGAEVLLVPIWGGKPSAMAARAIEHSAYVVASGYDYKSEVLDPLGSVLARVATLGQPDAAIATIDLARRFREDWSGDWRDAAGKQRRTAPYKAVEWTPPADTPPLHRRPMRHRR
jgi:predicted amidohydrolase